MNIDLKNRQHLLILVAVAVVGILLGDRLVVTPLWHGWKARSERLAELKKKVNEGDLLITRAESLDSRWAGMRTNALPVNSAQAESLMSRAFERWSQASNVSVSSYRPQWKRAGDDYMTLECSVDIAGELTDVTRFLFELENDPLGVKVDSASLATRDTEGRRITLALQVSGLQLISRK